MMATLAEVKSYAEEKHHVGSGTVEPAMRLARHFVWHVDRITGEESCVTADVAQAYAMVEKLERELS